MQNHGVFTIGKSATHATQMAIEVEEIAKIVHFAMCRGKPVLLPENGFYPSELFACSLISQIEGNRDSGKPFFAYLAFTAPHWPLQAREKSIEKYMGRYDGGYEQISASHA